MKRPSILEYSKQFALDSDFVSVDRKGYTKALEMYVDHLEKYLLFIESNKKELSLKEWEGKNHFFTRPILRNNLLIIKKE